MSQKCAVTFFLSFYLGQNKVCGNMLPHTQKSFCGRTDKNEHSSTGAKVAYNCFSDLHVFFRVSNKKKVFCRGPVCECSLTNVDFLDNAKKRRAVHLKFLVLLKKFVERHGLQFGVASKMRDFIRRNICLNDSQVN